MMEELVSAALRNDPLVWRALKTPADQERFGAASLRHGIQPLLYGRLRRSGAWERCPAGVRDALAREAKRQAALEPLRRASLIEVLAALADAGVFPLLLKGTALAYTRYPEPSRRPRCDTDLLIAEADRGATAAVLGDLGYVPQDGVRGELVSYQRAYWKHDRMGLCHAYDVHWKVANPQLFARTFSYEELSAEAITVPALGVQARTLGDMHALLLACMHRVAHHRDRERLIWLWDIHLMAGAMSGGEMRALPALAAEKEMRAIVVDGLDRARQCFGTVLPNHALTPSVRDGVREPSAVFLRAGLRRWQIFKADLMALPDWRSRGGLLFEHAFPASDYVLRKYGMSRRSLLPLLYARRMLVGGWKWARRLGEPSRRRGKNASVAES